MNNKHPDILIINGSPRKNKNCFNIINKIEIELSKNNLTYKIFDIYDMNIEYCKACGFCEKTGYCKYKDDMTPMYEMFDKSFGTIVVSPVYFDSISAKLKTVVDRTQAIYASKYILKKSCIDRDKKRIGMYISIGGSDPYPSQFKGGEIVMDFFFKSINTKLNYKCYINSSDKVSFNNNYEANKMIDENITKYITSIKELG